MSEPLRVIIVDDETPARRRMRSLLNELDDIAIVGECANGAEALAAIRELAPDLVFLDVQMPALDGFDVVMRLDENELPAVVFVTAYDQYALRAFDVNAVDYLLKPFDKERLVTAVGRARARAAQRERHSEQDALRKLIAELRSERGGAVKAFPDRLAIRDGGSITFVRVADIDWIESSHNYVTLHCGAERRLMRGSLKDLEKTLNPERFVRIHRSAIVNIDSIKEIVPWFHGDQRVTLHTGATLTLSRNRRSAFDRLVGESRD
ncbi:MAG TPA: LytTR family DNA-binding domain-containing protein [candidate division Zixibacteria bacterium]|nr:LytTR family DNA-binding domain-containing protein [candidate division Zixibacteria bacterium]